MTPGTLNLQIYRGITFSLTLTLTEDDGTTPIDLTGFTAYATARKQPTGAVKLDLAPEITDDAGGVIAIAFTDEDTAEFPAAELRWDLVLENAGGERLGPYLAGRCDILNPNTQPALP
jgi:hypothetical protein